MQRTARPKTMDYLWIFALTILGLVLRIPFTSHILYHWDSINYSLALKHYDIAHHQPQPPGYILYVLLTRLINALVNNPQATFVGLNIAGSILATIALYQLGQIMFNRSTGVVASLFLLFCPLFWFYCEIALPNVIDGLVTTLIAWFFYWAAHEKGKSFLPAAILLGLVGGFRQQTLVFMVPLAIYAMRKARFSQMVLAGGTAFMIFLCSFIPMIWLSGGWHAYRQDVSGLSSSFFTQSSILMGGGWMGLVSNVGKYFAFTAYSLSLAGIPLILWAIWKIRLIPSLLKEDRAWFLAMWILPSIAFYTVIHMGGHGLIFTYLPAVILIAAKALVDLIGEVQVHWRSWIWVGALGSILTADALLFAVLPSQPVAGVNVKVVNWATIRTNDHFFDIRFKLIQDNFDPRQSVILATNWRHLQYYLPQYHTISVPCGSTEYSLNISDVVGAYAREYQPLKNGNLSDTLSIPVKTVVFFDDTAECLLFPLPQGRISPLSAKGETAYVLQLDPNESLEFIAGKLVIQSK